MRKLPIQCIKELRSEVLTGKKLNKGFEEGDNQFAIQISQLPGFLFCCHNPPFPALRTKISERRVGISLRVHVACAQILSRAKKSLAAKNRTISEIDPSVLQIQDLPSLPSLRIQV
jgi:hypothetical protein